LSAVPSAGMPNALVLGHQKTQFMSWTSLSSASKPDCFCYPILYFF